MEWTQRPAPLSFQAHFFNICCRQFYLTVSRLCSVSYALVRRDSEPHSIVHAISRWHGAEVPQRPPRQGVNVPTTVPSKISYDSEGKVTWGYAIPDDAVVIECLKLLEEEYFKQLAEDQGNSALFQYSATCRAQREQLKALGKDLTTVISDYCKPFLSCISFLLCCKLTLTVVRELWKDVWGQINSTLGNIAGDVPRQIVLTFPNSWTQWICTKLIQSAQIPEFCDETMAGKPQVLTLRDNKAAAISMMSSNRQALPRIDTGDYIITVNIRGQSWCHQTLNHIIHTTSLMARANT